MAMNNFNHSVETSDQQWQMLTRWLHALIAISISAQLLLSLLMAEPDHLQQASSLQQLALLAHEYLGISILFLILAQWLWILLPRSDLALHHLLPLHASGRQRIKTELFDLIKHRSLPESQQHGGIAGLIHGLGLLTASTMALTGLGLYLVLQSAEGTDNPYFETLGDVHSFFGSLMWTYLAGHVVAALWHEYQGEHIIVRMFRLQK